MTTRRLITAQTHDPARGEFMVNALPVKDKSGKRKTVQGKPVYRAAHHITHTPTGIHADAHPEAFDFIVVDA